MSIEEISQRCRVLKILDNIFVSWLKMLCSYFSRTFRERGVPLRTEACASKSKPVTSHPALAVSLPLLPSLRPPSRFPPRLEGKTMIEGCDLVGCILDWNQKTWLGIQALIKCSNTSESICTISSTHWPSDVDFESEIEKSKL